MTEKISLKREYSLVWIIWGLLVVAAEVFGAESRVVWGSLIMLFLVIEGIALHRKKPGDTLTEHVLVFKAGGWARIPLILGGVGWAAFKYYTITSTSGLAALVLACGFGFWLLVHFLGDAKHG